MTALCSLTECDRNSRSGGMCEMHYHAEYRTRVGFTIKCERCGTESLKPSRRVRFCSRSCASRSQVRKPRPFSAVGIAMASGSPDALISAVRGECETSSGCWVWLKTLNSSGYPIQSKGRTSVSVHRIVLEAKLGRALGRMQAHHTCGVSACCNPDHLVEATQRANIAEMQARVSYEARIAQLEAALRAINPAHPIL